MRCRPIAISILAFACTVSAAAPARAQWVVFDAANTARNRITATIKEFLVATQELQHERIRRMATRLSAHTDLDRLAPLHPAAWRTVGPVRSRYAEAYNAALVDGDAAGAAYRDLAHPLMAAHGVLGGLSPAARRVVATQLATVDAADAAIVAATHDVGSLRALGRNHEMRAIDALQGHVTDASVAQSATAVLDKIAGAGVIGGRQRQARVQLLTALVEQLLVDAKRARDTEAAALNAQLTIWDRAAAVNHAFMAGSSDALRTWRQP